MSGIAGIIYLDGRSADRFDLGRMVDAMAHRGPDGRAVWCEGPVGLGHCMLHTTPESLHEVLPYTSASGVHTITADARIDNREELLSVLRVSGPAHLVSDSELILRAYERWGEACVDHLVGDFAFAIWDAAEQKLFCARDHLGVRPLYYYQVEGHLLVFASEVKALLALVEVPRDLDELRLASYLTAQLDDKEATAYRKIRRLPPAHALVVGGGGMRMWSYWALDPEFELQLPTDEAYVEAFSEVFSEAVRCRLRSAFPVGTHLSGGLDSSAVTCVARDFLANQGGLPLKTFSNIFDKVPASDERPYINSVVAQGGIEPYFVHADGDGPLEHLDELFRIEDEPYITGNYFLVRGLNEAMRACGIRIGLDGIDGDTTIDHGHYYLAELAKSGQWQQFGREVSALCERSSTSSPDTIFYTYGARFLRDLSQSGHWIRFAQAVNEIARFSRLTRWRLIRSYGIGPHVPTAIKHVIRPPSNSKLSVESIRDEDLVDSDFLNNCGLVRASKTAEVTSCRAFHWGSLTQGLLPYALEGYDRLTAASGIEVRHPFMDKRLIKICLALPGRFKLRAGLNRWILRAALHNALPESIRMRSDKADMTYNLVRGLTSHKERVESDLEDLAVKQNVVNVSTLRLLYSRIQRGNYTQRDVALFWRGFCVATWLERRVTSLISEVEATCVIRVPMIQR